MQGCWQSGRVVEAERRRVENRGSLEWDELLDDEVPVEGSQSSWAPKLAYGGEPAADAWERARHRKWKGEVAGNPEIPSPRSKRSNPMSALSPSPAPRQRPRLSPGSPPLTVATSPVALLSEPPTSSSLPDPPFPYSGRKRTRAAPTRPSLKRAKPSPRTSSSNCPLPLPLPPPLPPPTHSSRRRGARHSPFSEPDTPLSLDMRPSFRHSDRARHRPQPYWLPPTRSLEPPPPPSAPGPITAPRCPRQRRGELPTAVEAEGLQE